MKLKKFQFARQQHIFVALAASKLFVVQLQQRFTGWVCLHNAEVTLAKTNEDLQDISVKLRDVTATWDIPVGTWISWIMPSDIVGVTSYNKASEQRVEIESLFPFALADLKVSEFDVANTRQQVIYWAHNDWVNEVAKVSKQIGWSCDEIYSRAQLFQFILPPHPAEYRLLLEGDDSDRYLHIFAANGTAVRSTKVAASNPADLAVIVRREIGALSAKSTDNFPLFVCNLPDHLLEHARSVFDVRRIEGVELRELMIRLLQSSQTGIELQPTYLSLIDKVNAYSLAFAMIGGILLGLMVWHDGVLETEIEDGRRQMRLNTARYQTAKALRQETVKMADVIALKASIASEPPVFMPLLELFPAFTAPATLSYYDIKGKSVRVAGIKGDSSTLKSFAEKSGKFAGIKTMVPPDFLKESSGVFGLEMQWLNSNPVPDAGTAQKAVK